jgi:hypothetical protein
VRYTTSNKIPKISICAIKYQFKNIPMHGRYGTPGISKYPSPILPPPAAEFRCPCLLLTHADLLRPAGQQLLEIMHIIAIIVKQPTPTRIFPRIVCAARVRSIPVTKATTLKMDSKYCSR